MVIIHKDPRLDILAKKEAELNSNYTKALEHTTMGFRLLVMRTNDRQLVMRTRTLLMQKYPGQKNYLIYQAPYVKLQFGNFRTKEDAEVYRKQISRMLNGIQINVIPERIEMKPE